MLEKQNVKLEEQKSEIKEIKSNFNDKCNEQNNKFDARFDEQNDKIKNNFSEKLNEMRDKMKQQNVYINKSLEKVSAMVIQVQDEINESIKRKQGVVNGTL